MITYFFNKNDVTHKVFVDIGIEIIMFDIPALILAIILLEKQLS